MVRLSLVYNIRVTLIRIIYQIYNDLSNNYKHKNLIKIITNSVFSIYLRTFIYSIIRTYVLVSHLFY